MRSEGCSETPGGVQSLQLKKEKKNGPNYLSQIKMLHWDKDGNLSILTEPLILLIIIKTQSWLIIEQLHMWYVKNKATVSPKL